MPTDSIPRFDLAQVNRAIADTSFAGRVHHLASIPSTNSLAVALAHTGVRSGVWIADEQTAGRGRGSHAWHSAAGEGLYMSALIAPEIPADVARRLSFSSAIAVQTGIAATFGLKVRDQIDIRWPNDLMLTRTDGPQRKVGGILIETSTAPAPAHSPAMLRFAVIGMGVNLNHTAFPPELDGIATSIRRELPQPAAPLAREALAAAILRALEDEVSLLVRTWREGGDYLARDLTRFSSWVSGKRVQVEPRDGSDGYTATTAGLDQQGFLRVTADNGDIFTIVSGGLREL